jgi:CheY-like chemotaxis protein
MAHGARITTDYFTETETAHILARIMLVDDEVQQMQLRACIMRARGYQVLTASDPFSAIGLAVEERVDLAIVDYEMPGMDGCKLADRLRKATPSLKVVLYSGAIAIPESEIRKVDMFISKAEGIFELLRGVSKLMEPECRCQHSET